MLIAISLLNFRPGNIGGAETYIRRLLAHLGELRGQDRVAVVLYRDIADSVECPNLEKLVVPWSDRRCVMARIAEAYTPLRAKKIEQVFAKLNPDVAFFPQQSIFPKAVACPCVMTVVDIQHIFFPHYFGLFDRTFRARIYPVSLRRADHVIAISEYTRRTLIERCGVAESKVTAVPFGVEPVRSAVAVRPPGLPEKYIYYPAATFPHKGHDRLIRAMAQIKRSGRLGCKLVLTGRRTKLWDRLENLIAEQGLKDDVIHMGFLPFEQVQAVYDCSYAVVFPTEFEGFGLPALEAVQHDKKVICSRLAVFDEIGVPKQCQIDFDNPDELLAALELPGPTALTRRPWTWQQTAQATLDILRRTAAPPRPEL
ncbi:MAG: glycosyltransferase family 4 protein [Planctomycetes bacterium]|nr:glycosyltransferase family 4 protein [Planctomycetota bacterium]